MAGGEVVNEFYIIPDELRDAGFRGNKSIIAGYVHSRIMGKFFYDDRVPEAFVFPEYNRGYLQMPDDFLLRR